MSELTDRIARLTPEKRAQLERKLLAQSAPAVAVMRREAQEYALSFAQQRLWFIEQLEPGNIAYNYADAIRFAGPLNVSALNRSIAEIVRRHESFRTVFQSKNGSCVQRVMPVETDSWKLPLIHAENVPDVQRPAHIQQLTLEEAGRPFNLERGPLLRLKLLRFGEHDHVLLFVIHHIVFDGWSFGVFVRELTELYGAFAAQTQKRAALPELSIQYGDYAEWQRRRVSGALLDSQLAYWKKQLAALPTLALPLDRPRPPVQSYSGDFVRLELPPELTTALRALCKAEQSTLYMVLLAAFKILLHRYSGQDDIVVGTPIAGRTQPQFESLIGMFVNMLVLRSSASGNPTFREFLGRVRQTCLNAYAHQDVPFDRLVEAVDPERTPDRSPLFQVNFILQNTPKPRIDIPDLKISHPRVQLKIARFDLTLVLTERDASIDAVMEYNTALFDASTIERMLGHYQSLLAEIALNQGNQVDQQGPQCPIGNLRMLSASERREILHDWNNTARDYPRDKTIHALIAEQAARTPDAIAVTFEKQALTYAELETRAEALARRLRDAGVAPGVLVGICVERSLEMIVGVLAILKAGGAYVPLDPHYPADRIAFMIADTRMPVLLTQQRLSASLPVENVKVLHIDAPACGASDGRPAVPGAAPEDIAYCIYTSGSTGRPKGVPITHRALVSLFDSMREAPGFCSSDVLLSVTTLSFDICASDMFLPLTSGARICLVSREETIDGRALMRRIDESGASFLEATPSLWRMLLDCGWRGKPGLKAICGGEALPVKLAEQLLAAGVELWNMYGPTETAIWSSLKRIERADRISIGRPIANTRMYILNAAMQPVPAGVTGDLYIGGDGLSPGYLNRPELTAERFVKDPFSDELNARMYKTGDQARYLANSNGDIQYLGRGDGQVKIRGHRVELGEIETALGRHPDVRENVVVARESGSGDKQLAAYCTAKPGSALYAGELRAFLQKSLPDIMVPAIFVVLDSLPKTPNNKVDRKALPAPDLRSAAATETEPAPAQTDTERAVAEIWSEVLKRQSIGSHDNFFQLGGHSLLIFQVLSRIRERLNIDLPVRTIFDGPTVKRLAEIIDNMRWAGSETPANPADGPREESEI